MDRIGKIAERVAGEVGKKAILDGVRQHVRTLAALQSLRDQLDDYWSYGTAPDPVLEEMFAFSVKAAKVGKELEMELTRKMSEWKREADARGREGLA